MQGSIRWGAWIIVAILYLSWVGWLVSFPLELSSDDALHFFLAIERFSVVEFRPHFPGYPAFVALGKLVVALIGEGSPANVLVSLGAAIILPLVTSLLVYQISASLLCAATSVILLITQPLMASLGLNGLSDSTALALFIISLCLLHRQYYFCSGIALGLMLSSRPSYFILACVMSLLPMILCRKNQRKTAYLYATSGVVVIALISALFVWAKDGYAYVIEGERFINGHFYLWGNTAASESSSYLQWWLALGDNHISILMMVGALLFIAGSVYKNSVITASNRWSLSIALLGLAYLVWMVSAQNPDNLRHWAPVMLLGTILIALAINQIGTTKPIYAKYAAITVVTGQLLATNSQIDFEQKSAPIVQASQWIARQSQIKTLGSNYSVGLLREQLPDRQIYDMFYPSSETALQRASQGAWRLSGILLPKHTLNQTFFARFPGERTLYLYEITN